MAHADVYDIRDFVVKDDQGRDIGMRDLLRPVTLIVNIDCKEGHDVNTECKDLQHLYARFRERGLEIVAFPSDQFQVLSSQGKYLTGADVKADLAKRYGVSFPVMDKVRVNGDEAHPLFLFLQKRLSGFPTNAIKWDFTKFLIVNGEPTKRYAPTTSPHSIEGEITHALDNIRGSDMSQQQQQQQFSGSNISDSSQVPASYTSSVQSQPLQDTSSLQRSDDSTLGKGGDTIPSGLQVSEPEIREYDVRDAESNTQAHVVASRTEAVGTIPMSGQAQRSLGGQPFVHVKSVESTMIGQPRDTEEQSSKWSSQSVQGSQLGSNLSEGSGVSGEGVKSSDLGTRDWNAPASQQWETPEQSKELWKDDSKQNLQKPIQQQQQSMQQQPMQQQQQQPMQQSWRQDDSGKNIPEPGANLEYTHQGTHLRSGLHESRVSETSPFVQGTATGSHVMGVKPASHFHGSDPTYTDKQK